MFISVLFNTEYMDIASRTKWYLKNLLHCKENGWILITHEYMKTHFEELQKEITESLFEGWEMHPFAVGDVEDVEQYFIPDEIFDNLERFYGSRTEMLYQLSLNGCSVLEESMQNIFNAIRKQHPEDAIGGLFYNLETWQSIRNVCTRNNIPLFPYSFSAFRKPHGYRQTLYHVNSKGYLHTTEECKSRYLTYIREVHDSIPIFSNRELISILGKERTLPYIPLINAEPQYEMGICTDCFSIIPQFFVHDMTTDDDVRYECDKLFDKSQITVRNHSLQVDYMQLDRSTVHNDPASWILSCKRLTASRSQIGLKFLLWNRTAVIKPDILGFSFMCEKEYDSLGKVDIGALNYYIFGYLIPNDLMFSDEYWKWRITNPTECEIYQRHLDFYIEKLNLPKSVLTEKDESIRFKSILQSRGCDEELINILLADKHDFDIDYNTASSRIVVNGKSYWRLNKLKNSQRHFHIELNESTDSIDFYPLDDVAGCAKLVHVQVNGQTLRVSQYTDFKFMPKASGHYTLPISKQDDKTIIDIMWEYMSNKDFLNVNS